MKHISKEVSFSIAKLLKEKGFVNVCEQVYRSDGLLYTPNMSGSNLKHSNILKDESYSAPTIAEVIDWLYDKHKIWVSPQPFVRRTQTVVWLFDIFRDNYIIEQLQPSKGVNSPVKAYEAAIEYVLNNLL